MQRKMVTIGAAMYIPCIPVFVPATAVSGGGLWPDNLYFALSGRANRSEIECSMGIVDRH
jgi:hypothetical protein